MTASIHLHIERLVVDSEVLDGDDPELLAAEVRTALHGLLESHGLPGDWAAGETKASVRGEGGHAGRREGGLGTQIAAAVHGGLATPRGKP